MLDDSALLGRGYLQHLTDRDLALLARGVPEVAGAPDPAAALRRRPESIEELLGRPATVAAVLPTGDAGPIDPDLFDAVSPFLMFATAVHKTAADLDGTTYVLEWLGPRHRAPVFDVSGLREFLAVPWHRLFLAELLASYTKVSSGSVVVPTRRGLRRVRFSELDPVRLAGLLDVVPEAEHPGIYRRLGDLALFLIGVFPDHTALHGISELGEGRLLRAGRLEARAAGPGTAAIPGMGDPRAVELLEMLGRRWYRLAHALVPAPAPVNVGLLGELAEHFGDARRILNVLTDRYLFTFRSQWFGTAPS